MKTKLYLMAFPCLVFLTGLIPAWGQTQNAQSYMEAAAKTYKAGQYDLSAKYYEAAIKLEPESATAYQGLGNCYYHLGRTADALSAFDQSLAIEPNNPALTEFVQGLRAKSAPATEMASDADKEEIEKEIDEIEQEIFRPNWTEQLGLSYSSQPSQAGAGQVTSELDFTGTYHLTEGGHYFSVGGGAGKQKVEGTGTAYGKVDVEGGLGLGFFQPSLNFQFERGQTALNSNVLTATLNFQLWDPFTIGISSSGTLESHNGPASLVAGTSATPVQFDDKDYSGSVLATFRPWDFLGLSLTAQEEYDDTYQVQGLKGKVKVPLDQSDKIDSISLMADVTFLKNFEVQLTGQSGIENYPAGTVYSSVLGQTVTFSKPTSATFWGSTFALLYNFE